MKKPLIAFYSRSGENIVNGEIRALKTGNTERIALLLQSMTRGDLFQIEQRAPYSEDYFRCLDRARWDLCTGARPALKYPAPDMTPYDVIYLGFPNYWGTMPAAVFTFLESSDLGGKTVRPFCTHEGSGMGKSLDDLRRVCPNARIAGGIAIRGAEIEEALPVLLNWMGGGETGLKEPSVGFELTLNRP